MQAVQWRNYTGTFFTEYGNGKLVMVSLLYSFNAVSITGISKPSVYVLCVLSCSRQLPSTGGVDRVTTGYELLWEALSCRYECKISVFTDNIAFTKCKALGSAEHASAISL